MVKYEPNISILGILMMFSFLFMSADCKLGCFTHIRGDLEHYVLPFQKLVGAPIQLVISHIEETEFFLAKQTHLINEIKKLNHQNQLLLAQNQKKIALEIENKSLKALLNVSHTLQGKLLLADLIQVSADPFSHYILLDKGQSHGVVPNQAIIDTQGVIGLINGVNPNSSKVRLITDKANAVPVQNSRNGLRGIVSGIGKMDTLTLLHAPLSADYKIGDTLLTSGLGGRFPAGYPVGTISHIQIVKGQAFARILVKPLARLEKIHQVLIVTEKLEPLDASS